ncbi:MAG: hypothetical protein E3K37_14220 [Candidatus Kuenenia sp.]|nr:hypothetical protein [Candidatus Kuenenia hertensis]
MSKTGKIVIYIQLLVMVCLSLCNVGLIISCPKKQAAFPCKEHECGCKSEADCMTNCCCFPSGSRSEFQNVPDGQKNGLLSFISSVQCKSGSDVIAFINSNLKYILEYNTIVHRLAFLCFLSNNPLIHPCEPMVSPPEKPPRYFFT